MRTLAVLILVALINACAPAYVDPQFTPYLTRFEQDYKQYTGKEVHITNITMDFDNTAQDWQLGYCTQVVEHIGINPKLWPSLSEMNKELLIYHELGHCFLSREHDGTIFINQDRLYESIMYPYSEAVTDYYEHKPAYLKELFGLK